MGGRDNTVCRVAGAFKKNQLQGKRNMGEREEEWHNQLNDDEGSADHTCSKHHHR